MLIATLWFFLDLALFNAVISCVLNCVLFKWYMYNILTYHNFLKCNDISLSKCCSYFILHTFVWSVHVLLTFHYRNIWNTSSTLWKLTWTFCKIDCCVTVPSDLHHDIQLAIDIISVRHYSVAWLFHLFSSVVLVLVIILLLLGFFWYYLFVQSLIPRPEEGAGCLESLTHVVRQLLSSSPTQLYITSVLLIMTTPANISMQHNFTFANDWYIQLYSSPPRLPLQCKYSRGDPG